MTEALIDRVIKVCQDETYDKQAKAAILKELLRLFHVNEMQWKKSKSNGGEYFPEGETIIMYSQKTGKMWTDYWYSSCPSNYGENPVSHWTHLPEKPTN